MRLPLIIAILSLLAWTLLPQLDRFSEADSKADGLRAYLARLAHWMNG
jgi:hypothetical protein